MSNRSVSFASYVSCVEAQMAFLISYDGGFQVITGEAALAQMRECYERNVTVDGCANSLIG